jgi:N-methylhydantoinase A/oxoprolinase/acetone carboxylase beta subunit
VTFADEVVADCPVYRWSDLPPGSRLAGPAIVEGTDTTVVAPPAYRAEIDPWGNVVLTRNSAGPSADGG